MDVQQAEKVLEEARKTIQAAEDMLTLADVCRRFRVDRRTVYRWIRADVLIGYKLPGAGWRFKRTEVLAFQEKHRLGSA